MYLELYGSALDRIGYSTYYLAELDDEFEAQLNLNERNFHSVNTLLPKEYSKRWSLEWIRLVCQNKLRIFQRKLKHYFRRALGINALNNAFVDFDLLADNLRILEKVNFRPDLIVCMYLDMTRVTAKSRRAFRNLNINWIGLLFHPEPVDYRFKQVRNSWFRDASNRGGIFFTPKFLESYQLVARNDQIFDVFPDVTVLREGHSLDLDLNIAKLARGRRIIGLIGAIDGNKKLVREFLDLSNHDSLNDFFFVVAGEVYRDSLDPETLDKLDELSKSSRDNLIIYNHYISSESNFDYLIKSTDIIFACYKNFDSSANILAKSAHFRKPLLATANTWVGDQVEKYRLGIAVQDFNLDSLAKSILQLTSPENDFGFDDYKNQVSFENLQDHLKNFLDRLWGSAN